MHIYFDMYLCASAAEEKNKNLCHFIDENIFNYYIYLFFYKSFQYINLNAYTYGYAELFVNNFIFSNHLIKLYSVFFCFFSVKNKTKITTTHRIRTKKNKKSSAEAHFFSQRKNKRNLITEFLFLIHIYTRLSFHSLSLIIHLYRFHFYIKCIITLIHT
jgi:hypothetical protein